MIVTTIDSYPGQVDSELKLKSYNYFTDAKLGAPQSGSLTSAVCPAFVYVDEAHLIRQPSAGHIGIVRGIQRQYAHIVKAVWLTGTPFGKRPSGNLVRLSKTAKNGAFIRKVQAHRLLIGS